VKRDDNALNWLTSPLHGTLYEAIRKVAYGAVYRRFGVGSDELCQGSAEGPCRLVEICSKILTRLPQRKYSNVEEVAEGYARLVAKTLNAPGPAGVRQIDFLIDDFLQAHNGVAEDGRWRIKYEVEGPKGVETVEYIVDELDVLSALYGLAVLPIWIPQPMQLPKWLEDWFFVSGRKVGIVGQYLYHLLKERGGELVKRVVAIVNEVERRGFYTNVDLWRVVGITAAGQWDSVTDEELKETIKLTAGALRYFATALPIVLENVEPLLSEAWRRVESCEDGKRRQKLADWLTIATNNVAASHPFGLLFFLTPEKKKPDPEAVAQRFAALYNAASNAGRLQLLDILLHVLDWDIGGVNVAAILLGNQELGRLRAFEEVVKHIEEFVSHLKDVEKAYAVAFLYPRLAGQYASSGELGKATKFVEETLKALDGLWRAYERDGASIERILQPYLELTWVKPDLKEELSDLSHHIYHNVARVYLNVDELDKAMEYAGKACDFAKKLGDVYDEVVSCSLLPRLKAVKDGVPPVEEFEILWQKALQDVEWLGATVLATTLGEYVVALASADHLDKAEEILKEWGWALELDPTVSALTYGVISLFNTQYLEKVMSHLPEQIVNLPEPAGEKVELTLSSANLFFFSLLGLAHCNDERSLKIARETAWAGSGFKGIVGRLFGELYKALEGATVGNCITDEVFRAVYKLYYLHI